MHNAGLIAAEILLYFSVMAALFRMRARFGFGVFVAALGTMHFLENYLAAVLYVRLPLDFVASPGSIVLFTGKVVLLLLVYVRADAATVRQPIYGLLFGNLLIVGLLFLMRQHEAVSLVPGHVADLSLMDQMGWLMVWGTVVLFLDSILIILIYEKTSPWLGDRTTLRVWASAACVLTFDQLAFYIALFGLFGAPPSVLLTGWAMKMVTGACFCGLCGLYLRFVERGPLAQEAHPSVLELLESLTYRKRYEVLLERSGRDDLTGVLNRGRFEADGPALVRAAATQGKPISALVVDIDHFKAVNDRHGHAAGDKALTHIAQLLTGALRSTDRLFRYGGEEFVMLCPGLGAGAALRLADRLRDQIARTAIDGLSTPVTVSVGVAASPEDGRDLDALFACADARLYSAKLAGRNRVWGGDFAPFMRGEVRSGAA